MAERSLTLKLGIDARDAVTGANQYKQAMSGIQTETTRATSNMQQARQAMDAFVGALGAVGLAVGVAKIGQLISEFNELGDRVGDAANTFAAFGGSTQTLKILREDTRGLVDDLELMQEATQFMAQGLVSNVQQAGDLIGVARDLALLFQKDGTEAVDAFFSALATGRLNALREFGIDIQAVKERAQELGGGVDAMRQAILESAYAMRDRLLPAIQSNIDNLEIIQTQWQNIQEVIGVGVNNALNLIAGKIINLEPAIENFIRNPAFQALMDLTGQGAQFSQILAQYDQAKAAYEAEQAANPQQDMVPAMAANTDAVTENTRLLGINAAALERQIEQAVRETGYVPAEEQTREAAAAAIAWVAGQHPEQAAQILQTGQTALEGMTPEQINALNERQILRAYGIVNPGGPGNAYFNPQAGAPAQAAYNPLSGGTLPPRPGVGAPAQPAYNPLPQETWTGGMMATGDLLAQSVTITPSGALQINTPNNIIVMNANLEGQPLDVSALTQPPRSGFGGHGGTYGNPLNVEPLIPLDQLQGEGRGQALTDLYNRRHYGPIPENVFGLGPATMSVRQLIVEGAITTGAQEGSPVQGGHGNRPLDTDSVVDMQEPIADIAKNMERISPASDDFSTNMGKVVSDSAFVESNVQSISKELAKLTGKQNEIPITFKVDRHQLHLALSEELGWFNLALGR